MNNLISSFLLLLLFSCGQKPKDPDNNSNNSIELYNTFDKENHLRPDLAKVSFDTLHEWELGWALLGPINKASAKGEEEIKLSKRLLRRYWCSV